MEDEEHKHEIDRRDDNAAGGDSIKQDRIGRVTNSRVIVAPKTNMMPIRRKVIDTDAALYYTPTSTTAASKRS